MLRFCDIIQLFCGYGGIGRRAGFRFQWSDPCGFDPHYPYHVGMDYAPFKKPSHLAGLFSYRSVIPISPHKTLRCKFSWGPRPAGQGGERASISTRKLNIKQSEPVFLQENWVWIACFLALKRPCFWLKPNKIKPRFTVQSFSHNEMGGKPF